MPKNSSFIAGRREATDTNTNLQTPLEQVKGGGKSGNEAKDDRPEYREE